MSDVRAVRFMVAARLCACPRQHSGGLGEFFALLPADDHSRPDGLGLELPSASW